MNERVKHSTKHYGKYGGLSATVRGGEHDGHDVRLREDGIYCLTCETFYPFHPREPRGEMERTILTGGGG